MASRPRPRFDPRRLLATLAEAEVLVVLVGGVATRLHGSPTLTQDLDLVPEPSEENLSRLAAALNTLRPMEIVPVRRAPIMVEVHGADFRSSWIRSYVTRHGRVDVLRELPGGRDYTTLVARGTRYDLGDGLVVVAADLDDVIAAKEAADRPKDRADLARLRLLRDELRGSGGD